MSIKEYEITCTSKGRKYYQAEVHGKKSTYTVKIEIALLPDFDVGEIRTIYATFNDNSSGGSSRSGGSYYHKDYRLVPATKEEYDAEQARIKDKKIEQVWEEVQSHYRSGYISDRSIDYLHALGCHEHDEEIEEMRKKLKAKKKKVEAERWFGYIQNAAEEGYVYEKGIARLHELGCHEYDEEIEKIRAKVKAKSRRRTICEGTGFDSEWRNARPQTGFLILRDGKVYEILKVRYNREDGMSFGMMSDDWYAMDCKDVTETEEGQAFIEQKKADLKRHSFEMRAKQAEKALSQLIRRYGIRYASPERIYVEGEVVYDNFNIYGGGEKVVVENGKKVWLVVNNGADGDDWSVNNIITGGAGAYGYYVPMDVEIQHMIDSYQDAKKKLEEL